MAFNDQEIYDIWQNKIKSIVGIKRFMGNYHVKLSRLAKDIALQQELCSLLARLNHSIDVVHSRPEAMDSLSVTSTISTFKSVF